VYPIAGIGERVWTPNSPTMTSGFEKPDLSVIDIDLTGVMYTVSLAVQQFRRQEPKNGIRGKIGCVASVCGFYCVPTLPIYTAAKHGINGFVRSFGKYLPEEEITMNAVVSIQFRRSRVHSVEGISSL
jgi:NAD(P)-dependent dehydrogenase (short-subunit alcohol dehydrogenase family)